MSFWCDFGAGWFGGVVGLVVGHPFDTLKVRQQALTNPSLLYATQTLFKHEGLSGFFKGMYYPLLSAGALNSLFFGVYGITLRSMTENRTGISGGQHAVKPTNWEIFWAGCAGGAAQLVVACPVDLAKIKLQVQTQTAIAGGTSAVVPRYSGPYDVLRSIYKERGIVGWYKGLVPMAWRDIAAFGWYMILYNNIQTHFTETWKMGDHSARFWAGGWSGVISWISVIYLDVVKSRIQADDPTNPRYRSMLDCFQKCYAEGGARIFGRGMIAVSLRAFPLNGATFVGYEYFLDSCNNKFQDHGDSTIADLKT